MVSFISTPGGWELLLIGSCFLVFAGVAVALVLVVAMLLRKSSAGPAVICGGCGQSNPPTARFCSRCGQSIEKSPS